MKGFKKVLTLLVVPCALVLEMMPVYALSLDDAKMQTLLAKRVQVEVPEDGSKAPTHKAKQPKLCSAKQTPRTAKSVDAKHPTKCPPGDKNHVGKKKVSKPRKSVPKTLQFSDIL